MNFIATSNANKIAHDNVGVAENVVKKKRTLLNISQLGSSSVGITGLEPATSRPPEATQLALNPVDNQLFSFISNPLGDVFRDGFITLD